MPIHIAVRANTDKLRLARAIAPPIGYVALVPVAHRYPPDILGNPPRAARIDGSIDLDEFQAYRVFPNTLVIALQNPCVIMLIVAFSSTVCLA